LRVLQQSSLTVRSAVLACALALLFLTIVALPIEWFSLLKNAPSPIVEAHLVLWKTYFLPIEVVPNWGLVNRLPGVNSPNPAIALIPILLLLSMFWALAFFVVILTYKMVRRAA